MIPIIFISSDEYVDILSVNIKRLVDKNNLQYEKMFFLVNSIDAKENLYKYLLGTNLSYQKLNIFVSGSKHWGESLFRLCEHLIKLKYEKVCILLDDFFIDYFPSLENINKLVKNYDILYLATFPKVSKILYKTGKFTLAKVNVNFNYGINLQPAIWDIKLLASYSRKFELPWEFENQISSTPLLDKNIYVILPSQIGYKGQSIEKGAWYPFKRMENKKFINSYHKRRNLSLVYYLKKVIKDTLVRVLKRLSFLFVYFNFIYKTIIRNWIIKHFYK